MQHPGQSSPPADLFELAQVTRRIAHDLNNQLTSIRGNAELARFSSTPTELNSSLTSILDAVDRAHALARELMDRSRRHGAA